MTKCYEAWCNPFFEDKCLDCHPGHARKLKTHRRMYEETGIKFDKTEEDRRAFMRTQTPLSKARLDSEWYTPPEIIEAARTTMGSIDLDPASCEVAQETVQAATYYTEEQDGLKQEWSGNVWMNPPFTMPARRHFCERLIESDIEQACVLINNVVFDQAHMQAMLSKASGICLIAGRLKFLREDGKKSKSPLWGQTIVYFGKNIEQFKENFKQFGVVFRNG